MIQRNAPSARVIGVKGERDGISESLHHRMTAPCMPRSAAGVGAAIHCNTTFFFFSTSTGDEGLVWPWLDTLRFGGIRFQIFILRATLHSTLDSIRAPPKKHCTVTATTQHFRFRSVVGPLWAMVDTDGRTRVVVTLLLTGTRLLERG